MYKFRQKTGEKRVRAINRFWVCRNQKERLQLSEHSAELNLLLLDEGGTNIFLDKVVFPQDDQRCSTLCFLMKMR